MGADPRKSCIVSYPLVKTQKKLFADPPLLSIGSPAYNCTFRHGFGRKTVFEMVLICKVDIV
jgi:hypothetical protein